MQRFVCLAAAGGMNASINALLGNHPSINLAVKHILQIVKENMFARNISKISACCNRGSMEERSTQFPPCLVTAEVDCLVTYNITPETSASPEFRDVLAKKTDQDIEET